MPKNEHYLGRVPPQHRKPKFLKWLDTNIQPFFDSETLLKAMDALFELDNSEGVQLNVTGDIVGRNRVLSFDPADGSSPILDDDTYRLLQKAKISLNQWDGTIPGILALWETLFPQYRLIIQDNQDMTMDLYVVGLITPLEQELLTKGYIAPKPMGVFIRFTFVYERDPIEHTAFIAGMRHDSITISEMPPFVPDFLFKRTIHAAGMAQGVSITQIPPHTIDYQFHHMPFSAGSLWGISTIKIPPYLPEKAFNLIDNASGAKWSIAQTTLPKGG